MRFGNASQEVWPGSFAQVWAQVVVSPSPSLVKWPSCIWRPGGSSEGKHAASLHTASCPVPLATGSALLPEHALAEGADSDTHTFTRFPPFHRKCRVAHVHACVKHTRNASATARANFRLDFCICEVRESLFFFFKSTPLIATQEELGVSSAFGSSQGVWACGGKYLDLLIEGSPRKRSWRRDGSLSNKMNPPQSTGLRKKFCGQNSAPKAVPGRPLCSSPAHGLGSPPQSLKSGCSHSPTDPQK